MTVAAILTSSMIVVVAASFISVSVSTEFNIDYVPEVCSVGEMGPGRLPMN